MAVSWMPKRLRRTAEIGGVPDDPYTLCSSIINMEDIMALILGVKIGDVVDIAERWIKVLSIDGRNSATLVLDDGRKIAISARRLTRMMPDVWVGMGPEQARSRFRLMFDAPRHVSITRRHA
jgi:hypothetical protein